MIILVSELVGTKTDKAGYAYGGRRATTKKDDFQAIQCKLLDRNALKYQLLTPKWLIHAIN